jgi:hypothetical protein
LREALFGVSREGLFLSYLEGEMSSDLLLREVAGDRLIVAIDPGKVSNRVWLTSGERGLIGEPVSLPVLRDGVDELARLIAGSGVAGTPVIGIEATGALHRAWAARSNAGGRGRCGCSRHRRRRPPGRSSGRGA